MAALNPSKQESEDSWRAQNRKWTNGWRRLVFPSVFLFYLLDTASGISEYSRGNNQLIGYLVLAAFIICYLLSIPSAARQSYTKLYPWLVAAMIVLYCAELPYARGDTFIMGIFVIVPILLANNARSILFVLAACLAPLIVPLLLPSWHSSPQVGMAGSIALAAAALYAYFALLRDRQALADARVEIARLATENERSRIARDLHDLLGHSLTTIVVKAGLARRLFENEPDHSLQEITEVEELARSNLAQVRDAITGYREVSLTTELATAGEVLRAAGLEAVLPNDVNVVPTTYQQLFGWVVREGVTNVVRHANATICTVRLTHDSIEISDNGIRGTKCEGNGLRGLRERVTAEGGSLTAGPQETSGWLLKATLAQEIQRTP